jgi:hypothetical protein
MEKRPSPPPLLSDQLLAHPVAHATASRIRGTELLHLSGSSRGKVGLPGNLRRAGLVRPHSVLETH